ncbi:2'-5' RNA ligase family protein [Goodfellowiella coeruleoviolacea]|uniref:2'-5' RNA ligase n=1 Tax=Goodfellowiella coeruleoviolacea TaxID=334858 RepID=A0AAE3GH31_9PSEU|nr:2'-5' RNA ligase family protein [Goodfellowiella coeruleoviolacea]MCP2168040.1 2'-5' RNA ligase [Goodfellowiella coeruleoviolacea]
MIEDAQELRDHWWWRPGWKPGRHFYTWHLTFAGEPALHALITTYQNALRHLPGLDLIPHDWLHLTMQGVGFVDEVSKSDAHAIAEAAQARLAALPAPTLTFDKPSIRPEAIALPPQPAEPVHHIRTAIRAAIADVWGPDRVPEQADGYQPHLSLAYVRTDGPATPVRDALSAVTPDPVQVTIHTASLIRLERANRLYRWQEFTTAALTRGTILDTPSN